MVLPAIDMHCDTLMKIAKNGNLDGKETMVTLRGLREGGVAIQCFADFVPTGKFPKVFRRVMSKYAFEKLYRNYRAMMSYHRDALFPVLCAADLDKAGKDGKIGVLFTIEDGGVMGDRIENVRKFYDRGVRLVTLTWNHANAIGYPNSRDPESMKKGLTDFGREVVKEMGRLGMIVDISHVSDGVFYDVAKIAEKPFVASHSNSRALCGHPRNMTDHMIRILAEKGGVMGINIAPGFLAEESKESRIEDMVRHILHIQKVGGDGVLALGSDFDGVTGKFELSGPGGWPKLAQALEKAGFSQTQLEKMWYKNAEAVFRAVLV